MVEVFNTDEFGDWFDELAVGEQEDVVYVVRLLAQGGVALGHPNRKQVYMTRRSDDGYQAAPLV